VRTDRKEHIVKRRTAIMSALVATALALGVMPALAQNAAEAPQRARQGRSFPPAWIDETVAELRERIAEGTAALEERITDADRPTDEQKAEALASLAGTTAALEAAEEKAELVGIVASRRQLARLDFRATRRGETADLETHITRDVEGTTRRLDHLTRILGWAEAAGEDVSGITGLLDEAGRQLDVAAGGGTAEQRHDAVHIARAWMTEAGVTLMGS
jgi:hypothetical protein